MKKQVHIISHSHWDREWYMPHQQHNMRLVELFDDLFELFETDPEFKSFHLDGQTLPLDDYLAVRPQAKEQLKEYIQAGKLKIGPFYILQDDFLISSEANVRNVLIGLDESRKWGEPVLLGYFPDTFGNMGQAPQIMKQAGINAIAFGRGVKTTGFNNVVVDEDYSSKYSEINWTGSDGTEIFSILFANWYSNGNEIPNEKEAAIAFWDTKLEEAERYASTRHLLMMNGVDHQPVQKDVSAAIRLANNLYPDYEFIHSSFDDYLEAVQKELPDDLGHVQGELTSQETDGWYTLANTSSSRIYLKQANTEVQNLLERVAEPLAVMAHAVSGEYPHDKLRYAWKLLMQNHPHDSICGCSVDSVHRGMMTRFEDAKQVGLFVKDESLRILQSGIDTSMFPESSKPFTVFNSLGTSKTGTLEIEIEWERSQFDGRQPKENYQELVHRALPNLRIADAKGNDVPFDLIESDVRFNYDLPKDGFRVPYMARYVSVRLSLCEMAPFSWKTFAIEASDENTKENALVPATTLENDFLKVVINDDGRIDVHDLVNGHMHTDIMHFDDTGDIGNEYIYTQSFDRKVITSSDADVKVRSLSRTELSHTVELVHTLMIPKSADALLRLEQESVTEIRDRKATRSDELVEFEIRTEVRLDHNSSILNFKTRFDNQAKDHRLRVLFDAKFVADVHHSESIYEVVTRPNKVSESWKNPSNPQHQQTFTSLENDLGGIVVGNHGLNEYEIVDGRFIAVTLLRSVGEMGDWGYFPTPEAQCIGESTVQYAIGYHGVDDKYELYKAMKANFIDFSYVSNDVKTGTLAHTQQFLKVTTPQALVSSLKLNEYGEDIMVRLFNLSNELDTSLFIEKDAYKGYASDVIESDSQETYSSQIKKGEIKTVRLKKETQHD